MIPRKDLLILSALRSNAREKLTRISKRTQVPISTIFDRIKYYEGSLILGHKTLIDFSRLGYATRAQLLIKTDKDCRDALRDFLVLHHHANSVSKINNGFDYLVELIFTNLQEMEAFIEMLERRFTIQNMELHYIIEDIKKEGFMADPEMVGMFA